MTAKQIAGYLKAKKAPDGISFNDGYNMATYGITMDEYRAIDRAMHDAYGLAPKRTPAGVREALRLHGPSASRHHSTRLQFPRWRVDVTVGGDLVKTFYETATTAAAAIGKAKHKMRGAVSSAGAFKFKATAAEADPLKRDLEKEFLAGAPMPVFDKPRGGRSHSTKKSPAQLQREIDEVLAKPTTASKETSVLPPSVRVARAGLEQAREYGLKNLRYGLYRHSGDRMYQWGNFTGTPESVITAVVPNATNTASQDALIRALKWKR